jgi:hypothetical protein
MATQNEKTEEMHANYQRLFYERMLALVGGKLL